jgi:uncharacterized protein YjiS (DUF1127 family)
MTTGTTGILPRAAITEPRAGPGFPGLGARLQAAFARIQERARTRRMQRHEADYRVIADLGISPAQAAFAPMQERARMRRMLRHEADYRVIADLGISPAQPAFEAPRFLGEAK